MGFDYYYDYGFDHGYGYGSPFGEELPYFDLPPAAETLPSGFGVAVVVFIVAILMVVLAVSLLTYVLQSLGLYTMAKNRRLENPWLAWVPVANCWTMGAIADDANARRGKKTSYAIILVVLQAAAALGGASLFLNPLLGLGSGAIGLAALVFYYITLYEIYRDYAGGNAVLFLVLSILFSIQWVFLFALRGRRPASLEQMDPPAESAPPAAPAGWEPAPQPPEPVPTPPQDQPPVGWCPGGPAQTPAAPRPQYEPELWEGMIPPPGQAPQPIEPPDPTPSVPGMNDEGEEI